VGKGLGTSHEHRVRVPARGWRGKRLMARGGTHGDGHEVSILIRLGGGDCAGRGPSNVSTMIMRPPQHGHWCASVLASLAASACALPVEASGAASKCRTRSML